MSSILVSAAFIGCNAPDEGPAESVAVTDDVGRTIALESPPSRIVSVVPSITESILALDAGHALVARTRFDRQPELTRLPSVGGALDPNLEAVVHLRPDLFIFFAGLGRASMVKRVESFGIPVYRADVQTLDDFRSHLRRLGVLLGIQPRSGALLKSFNRTLDCVARAAAGRPPVDVYYSLWHRPPQTAGAGTFIDELLTLAGGRNVMADAPGAWPQVSLEELVRRDPDALVIASHDSSAAEMPWLSGPGWRDLTAVREGRYLVVDGDLFNRPGPRVTEAARDLLRFLHGEDLPDVC